MDDFSEHPETLGEWRSDATGRAKDWTPRELLVSLLRDIDNGEFHPDVMVIGYRDSERNCFGWVAASPDPLLTIGAAAHVAHRTIAAGYEE